MQSYDGIAQEIYQCTLAFTVIVDAAQKLSSFETYRLHYQFLMSLHRLKTHSF